jgi:hypothetical protein
MFMQNLSTVSERKGRKASSSSGNQSSSMSSTQVCIFF